MTGITDIAGVYCPMGCGRTLHLMPSGMIQCLEKDCPNPGAAQTILSNPETTDIVVFGTDSYTVLHPLKERLGDLFSCEVHAACGRLPGPPGGEPGRYRATYTGDELSLAPIDEDPLALTLNPARLSAVLTLIDGTAVEIPEIPPARPVPGGPVKVDIPYPASARIATVTRAVIINRDLGISFPQDVWPQMTLRPGDMLTLTFALGMDAASAT